MSAKSARIETATRSPSIRLFSFVFTIASAVRRRDVCVGERGLEVGVRDERGAAGELRLRLGDDTLGTAGLFVTPVRNDAVSAEMRTAPASAVPIDAPSCVPVFWIPHLAALFIGHRADTVTAPSCEAIEPIPAPQQSGQVTIAAPAP